MNKKQQMVGWIVAVSAPFALYGAWEFIPGVGALIAAGAVIGAYIGFILYEHTYFRSELSRKVVSEQISLALLLMVLFSFAL